MTDIQTLIQEKLVDGVNPRTLADRAKKAGLHIKHQTIYELSVAPPKAFPKLPSTIEALAYVLGVSQRAVVLAYAQGLGIDVGSIDLAAMLPASARDLTPDQRDAVLAVVKTMNPSPSPQASPADPTASTSSAKSPVSVANVAPGAPHSDDVGSHETRMTERRQQRETRRQVRNR